MRLRPRQKVFVERSLAALDRHGNTLGIAPTGAGKTIVLSAVTGALVGQSDAKACVLAHRDELTSQNRAKFQRVNEAISTSVFDARQKSWEGQATFAMVPTLTRPANLKAMPALDLLVIDEAHHAAADSYRRIVDSALERNPACKIYGVTATPNRGDRQGLRPIFSNVADQIKIGELIQAGHLVRPRTFVIDLGVQETLKKVRRTADDFNMADVEAIMDRAPINEAVIQHWQDKAGDRQTVVFCSTVAHASNVCEAFKTAGVAAGLIHGDMREAKRKELLQAYATGAIQVITNVAVLTEGWDHPPTSCVILLRPSSYKSTMIQMVGRGLRVVLADEYPGLIKDDCIVLDFGTSSLMHGSLEQDVDLDGRQGEGEAVTKVCPDCQAEVPAASAACPLCGHLFEADEDGEGADLIDPLSGFIMAEIDLLKRSSFYWCDLFGDDAALIANGFHAWAGIFFHDGRWHAVGGKRGLETRILAIGERMVGLAAADDWLNDHESDETAHKSRKWLAEPATAKQLAYLPPAYQSDYGLTRYHASALMTFQFNKQAIKRLVLDGPSYERKAA